MTLTRKEQAVFALRELYAACGYRPYRMSRFEEYDLYIRNKEFLESDEVLTFAGRDGRLMALKPDVTLSIVKNAPQGSGEVQKVYYNESVYRADKDTHDFRELTQTGLECVGDLSNYDIVEVVLLAQKSLALLGAEYVLDISHMGLLEAVLSEVPSAEKKKIANLLKQKNLHELKELCEICNCSQRTFEKLKSLVENAGRAELVLPKIESKMDSPAEIEALRDLRKILSFFDEADSVRIDFSVANAMSYYNGIVFRGYLAGIPDAVLSGGQYDRLPARMGRGNRAIGFALCLDLLERLEPAKTAYQVDVLLLHDNTADVTELKNTATELSSYGSVLVATVRPENYRWKMLYEFTDGEAKFLEENA